MTICTASRSIRLWPTLLACLAACAGPAVAAPVLLGSAAHFAVQGMGTVTNTGVTTIVGDIGVHPGTALSGLGSVVLTGTVFQYDATAQQAQADAQTGYNRLSKLSATTDLTGQNLGGLTLQPGTYFFASAAELTGTLTLDAMNDPTAMFVFQIGSDLTTAGHAVVNILNGSAENVYWQVGSSATLGSGTLFAGSLIAGQDVTLNPTAALSCGRVIALNGAVTMDSNTVSTMCAQAPDGGGDVPEPPTLALVALALAGLRVWPPRAAKGRSAAQIGS